MWKKLLKRLTALVLIFSQCLRLTSPAVESENLSNMYVSEISIGTKEELLKAGFTVSDENLNEGGTATYLGYKLTDDPKEAITDLSVLEMYGHYAPMTYQETLLNDSESVIQMGLMLETAANAFAEKYRSGSPFAILAYDTLNARTVPNERGEETPLGTFLLSEECDLEDYKKIGLVSSNVGIAYVLNQLCLGAADNTIAGESSWIDRLSANGPLDFTDEETGEVPDEGVIDAVYKAEYDDTYMQRAHRLYAAVSAFAGDYLEAKERSGSIETISVTEEEADEALENAADAITGGSTLAFEEEEEETALSDEAVGDLLPLAQYALLDERDEAGNPVYPFGTKADGTARSLAEYFIEVGTMEAGSAAYRALYPLMIEKNGVTPLSEGQEVLMYLSGLSNMITAGAATEDSLNETRTQTEACIAEMLSLNNGEALPLWYDVNLDIYEECQEGVYWTSELAREAAAGDRYDLLTKPAGSKDLTFDQKLKNAAIYAGCVGIAALGATLIAVKVLAKCAIAYSISTIIGEFMMFATSAMVYTTGAIIGLCVGMVFIAVAVLAVVALIVIGLIYLFKKIFGDDEEEKFELTEIPKVMYDYSTYAGGTAVTYNVVNYVGTETPANLNAGVKNTAWIAVYYSKSEILGEPITAEYDGETLAAQPFVIQKGSQEAPENYCPLCVFEAYAAANLNDYRSNVTNVYAFFHRLGGEVPVSEDDEGIYLASLKLFTATGKNAAETVKNQAIIEHYELIDFNLTSDSGMVTCVGYKSTNNAEEAITDIRVAYASGVDPDSGSILYGGAKYGCYGNVGNLLLMETKFACMGTPILVSDLIVTDTLGNAPAGYEPVNLFCGGPAFDFNNCNLWEVKDDEDDFKEGKSKWGSHAYIYFHPSVTYTSGTEYLGGLAFFSGNAADYMTEAGWTPLTNANLNGGSDEGITYNLGGVQGGTTTLAFTTTRNPYRAIYDIQYFGAEASTQVLQANLSLSSGSAYVCDVFQQGCGSVGDCRLLRISHAYRSNLWYEGGGKYAYEDYVDQTRYQDKFTDKEPYVEWYDVNGEKVASNICCAGLYVVGNKEEDLSGKPIEIAELVVSASPDYDASSMTPVRTITDTYAETGANLAFNDLYHSGNMYLYIQREDPYAHLPSYVLSVQVAYVVGKDMDSEKGVINPHDTAVFQLVGNGAGRLLEIDLTGAADPMERVTTYTHEYVPEYPSIYAIAEEQKVKVISHDSNYAAALVWVTYTKARVDGVGDLVIYESTDGTLPAVVTTAGGAETKSCGDGFQLDGKGTWYYLRTVYDVETPITDLIVDEEVMTPDYWTTISTEGKASGYTKYFIKAKHFRKASLTYYISGIYSASGASDQEALLNLLNTGCRFFCPFNLSPDNGKPLYLGYTLSSSYKEAFSGIILHDGGQDNAIDTIKKGYDVYTRVTDSLNSGVYDSLIKLYVTSSARKACEMGATRASKGHYITEITFFSNEYLNDYATGDRSLDELDEKSRAYVEKYIYDSEKNPVYWDIVTDSDGDIINCNVTALKGGILDTSAPEVYMYIHYSDNATPYYDSLAGSIFTKNPVLSIVLCSGGGLVLLGAAYLVMKKRKENAKTGPASEG